MARHGSTLVEARLALLQQQFEEAEACAKAMLDHFGVEAPEIGDLGLGVCMGLHGFWGDHVFDGGGHGFLDCYWVSDLETF